jgi:acetolactate synthase I/II/III large subunit
VADVVAGAIADAGTEVVFTFPGGGSNLALLEALQARGVGTVLARSEGGGAFMAATVADLTDVPGVLIVGLGPGAASSVNGVAHALLDRSPLVLIVDRYSAADAGTTTHQLLDHAEILGSVVKACVDATPEDMAEAVASAIATALEPPRGPVLIEMRRDRARAPVGSTAEARPSASPREATRANADVTAVARALSAATRPVMLVGEEARRDLDQRSLVRLAEMLEAPVLATYKGKGTFPESHRLAAGIVTGAAIERPLLAEADLLLGVGLDPVELLARPWPFEAPVVALRRTGARDDYLSPRWTLAGELEQSLQELLGVLEPPNTTWELGASARWRESILGELRMPSERLSAVRAVEVAQQVLGDPIVTVDAGAHMFAATWFWRSERPNRFHVSNGLATMGFAVPAAIGAAIAHPEDTVVAFTGDGGFTINAAELETAARVRAKVIVLVLNDASLSLIRVKQADIGWRRSNVDFVRSDFAAVAEGLGVRGARASSEDALREALVDAAAATQTTVIDVALDGEEYGEMHRRIRGAS